MCVDTMDFNSKHTKANCLLRKVQKRGSNLRWKIISESAGLNRSAKPCHPAAVGASVRKYLHRQQKLAKLVKVLGEAGRKDRRESMYEESPSAACISHHPSGAMAPENTTQYLMSKVYEDMREADFQAAPATNTSAQLYSGSMSPRSVYAALDSDYESCLAFQQRDFEEMFGLC